MNKITFPLKLRMQGPAVADLQDALQHCLDRGAILATNEVARRQLLAMLPSERAAQMYGESTGKVVSTFQKEKNLQTTGEVDEPTASALNALLKQWGLLDQVTGPAPTGYQVQGKVASLVSAGVGGLRVVIVDKGVGGDAQLAQATTDDGGAYQTAFTDSELRQRGKAQPDLQARVFAGEAFLAASDVHYNASQQETLNVLLQDSALSALRSEHEVLTSALAGHFKGKLSDLKETDQQQDITYLANKTGWDARAVALAALADQFSTRTADSTGASAIPQAFFYALFRAGLPANEDLLYHTDAQTVEAVWKKAAEQGVIPKASVGQIPSLIGRFQALSAQKLLTGPALVGASSLKEMLTVSRLNDAQQARFAQLYAANRRDMPAFWKTVGDAFGQDIANRLKVDGKLGFLTINNAPLMLKVHATVGPNGLSDPLQLAQMGYHRAQPWNHLLTADVPLPKEIPGDTAETKRANYAAYLAAQVRLSYPTAAVAQLVKSGDLPLTGAPGDVSGQVQAFLTQQQGKFELGVQPVQQYVAKNNLQVAEETVGQIQRLQRVYQITASDQAMIGLMKRGIDAAYHVVRYDKDAFVQSFAADLGGADQAALTYNRSVQIHNAVLNVALSYLHARTAPAIGVHSPAGILDPAPANPGDVIAYATLESLFGSMDFCACDHCRSILSPAAYLVDLLLFLKSDPDAWAAYLTDWHQSHANAPYPFVDQNAWQQFQKDWNSQHPQQPLPNTELSPFDVLMSRRPDIQHLPLTCENTNTVLPYIDIVNETLEYYVADGLTLQKRSLDEYHGHDTNGAASEDLLASPQFVMEAAYATLLKERFPSPLPFHQPLENLRRYFNKFEIPLPLAMERLRKTDDLDGNPYGWRDILMEVAGFSRAEYEILTDSNIVPLWRMYGFPNGTADADVIAGLSNAKQFARRLGITYEELVAVLQTRFINPNSDLIPKLARLGVPFVTLKALKGGSDTDFDKRLAALAVPPDPAEYGGDIKVWVRNDDNYSRIMALITLAVPAGTWAASKAYVVGDCVQPTAPPPGSTLYYECTTSGKSAALEPKWPLTPGNPMGDGTVFWTCRDASSCSSFDNLAFRYADPAKVTQNIGAAEFFRLLRFIRVWKKLGWTVEQTDAMICALYRTDLAPLTPGDLNDPASLDTGFKTLLPRLGIVLRVMEALNLTVQRDLLSLLSSWSEIGTHGDSALYRQMFLNPALLKQNPVFDDNGYGDFLSDNKKYLADHAEALRSAFNLTGDEYDRIVAALGYDSKTPLTVPNVSAIYRRGWLARNLKLSVRELLLLIQLTGVDPFSSPDPATPAILRLISLVQALKDRSLKSAAALYLIWNQDLSGKSAPDPAGITELARTLRGDFAGIEDQFAAIEDPSGDVARARMTLVYGQETSDAFFALLDDSLVVDVAYTHSAPALEPAITAVDPRIAYDNFRHRLSHQGLVTTTLQAALKNVGGVSVDFQKAVDALFSRCEDAKGSFFARNSELKPIFDQVSALDQTLVLAVNYTHPAQNLEAAITAADNRLKYDNTNHRLSYSGVLTVARRDILKSVPDVTLDFQSAVDALFALSQKARGAVVLAALQPELVRKRKRQQALQRLSAAAGVDPVLTQTLLDPAAGPYPLHAGGDPNNPALNDVLALETPGLAAQFFFRDTATGNVDQSVSAAANLAYASGGSNPLPNPGNAISGIWNGQVEIPEAGFYNLIIDADVASTAALTLDGKLLALTQNGSVWRNTDPLELKAGALYKIEIKVEKVKDALTLNWETPKQAREVIPSRYLYPPTILEPFSSVYIRFLKAASLATGLVLTANELSWFATHSDYRINAQGQIDSNGQGWLNALPNADNLHLQIPADAAVAKNLNAALLTPLGVLLDFARIKAEISPSDESLLTVLMDSAAATQSADSLLFIITRWNQGSLNDVLVQFGGNIARLGHFDLFRRVYDAFAPTQKMGISAKALLQAATNEPTADTVRDLQAALRARYDPAAWRDVIRPINDEVRGLQRDALVVYILQQMRSDPESAHIDTPDKLFEYFLMDVQMDPCMQTSRIRHALSSVQLFIERCLMNLEPRVSPAAFKAKQWEWMKRYRVWEANRKVYLYPENWLDPELRDDKSPFFKEFESELLQGDISEERAATALLNYLSKLEEVAKLEPCGIYYVPAADPAHDTGGISHVVARTAGAHRKYYYRRYEYGYWTPWEQIKLDIEDNPVIPIIWNDRLLLFWLRVLKKGPDSAQKLGGGPGKHLNELTTDDLPGDPAMTAQAVLCWSEYYNGKWQSTKTSDINHPIDLGTQAPSAFDRSALQFVAFEEDPGALRLCINSNGVFGPSFVLYNTHSLPLAQDPLSAIQAVSQLKGLPWRGLSISGNDFTISYRAENWHWYDPPQITRDLLQTPIDGARTIEPRHWIDNPWKAPLFFEDSRHVFYVTSEQQPVWVADSMGIGAVANLGVMDVPQIAPLVMQSEQALPPKYWGDGGPISTDPGVIASAPIQRFITEDAYIRRGVGTTSSVRYGDFHIGPSGAIRKSQSGT